MVSATVDKDGKRLYIVDGHNSAGVSGGPVWCWNDERQRAEIVGVVSGYGDAGGDLPGFCVFEPINPVLGYLCHWTGNAGGDFVHIAP